MTAQEQFTVVDDKALISTFILANQPEQALEVVWEMRLHHRQPEVDTYTALINAFAKANQFAQALEDEEDGWEEEL